MIKASHTVVLVPTVQHIQKNDPSKLKDGKTI